MKLLVMNLLIVILPCCIFIKASSPEVRSNLGLRPLFPILNESNPSIQLSTQNDARNSKTVKRPFVCTLHERIEDVFLLKPKKLIWSSLAKQIQLETKDGHSVKLNEGEALMVKPARVPVACWVHPSLFKNINNTSNEVDKENLKTNTSSTENLRNFTEIEILHSSQRLHSLMHTNLRVKSRSTPENCTLVLYYAKWCAFSAKAAPHYNALPRVFPAIRMLAIDASYHEAINSYFGIISVPTLILYHNGKSVAKYNETVYNIYKFIDFITTHTDQKPIGPVNVTSRDFHGPLSSFPEKKLDINLFLAWIFIIICFFYYISKSVLWLRVTDFIRTTWREAEAQHEHND